MGEDTYFPSSIPSSIPTNMPTVVPTRIPTYYPSSHPTLEPTMEPTSVPTSIPTSVPSLYIYNNNDNYNDDYYNDDYYNNEYHNNNDISLSLTIILAIMSFIIIHNVYQMNKVKIQKCLNTSIKVKPIERSDYTGVIPIEISDNSIQ